MTKNYNNFIHLAVRLPTILLAVIFCFSANITFSAGINLEVQYPKIGGFGLNANPTISDFIKYWYNAGMFIGFAVVFFSFAVGGAMYLFSSLSVEMKTNARERISGAISGLLILVMTYLIIATINPQISLIKFTGLPESPALPVAAKYAGVYFYNGAGCPANEPAQPNTSSISSFDFWMANAVNSVGISPGENDIPYFSILYSNPGLWGKCAYINGNDKCVNVEPFATSASIYKFDDSPGGSGVYFFRKSCLNVIDKNGRYIYELPELINYCKNNNGGWLFISNADIENPGGANLYSSNLDQLKFTGLPGGECTVPKEEQDCTKYDTAGNCTARACPTLAGKNISSIKIKGDYIVLLIYVAPGDKKTGPWSSCQEFPTSGDVNKAGPNQIKWENIMERSGVLPNDVMIIPIKQ